MVVVGDPNVVEDCHFRPETDVLKCPGNPHGCHLMRIASCQVSPLNPHFPVSRVVDSADQIEDRGFAGSVGADQAHQLSSLKGEVKIRNGLQPSKKMG